MIRWLVIGSVLYMVYRIWKSLEKASLNLRKPPAEDTTKEMIPCSKCGMYILKSTAIVNGKGSFCSEACQRRTA